MIGSKEIPSRLQLEKHEKSTKINIFFAPGIDLKIDDKTDNNHENSLNHQKKEDFIEKENVLNNPVISKSNGNNGLLSSLQNKLILSTNARISIPETKKVNTYNANKWILTEEEKNSYGDRFPEEYSKLDFLGRYTFFKNLSILVYNNH